MSGLPPARAGATIAQIPLVASRHDMSSSPHILVQKKSWHADALVGQHGATRSSRRARQARLAQSHSRTTRRACRVVTCRDMMQQVEFELKALEFIQKLGCTYSFSKTWHDIVCISAYSVDRCIYYIYFHDIFSKLYMFVYVILCVCVCRTAFYCVASIYFIFAASGIINNDRGFVRINEWIN